jgi:hypothetical protein
MINPDENDDEKFVEVNYLRAKYFSKKQIPVHIILKSGIYYNGIIDEVTHDFFFINDKFNGRKLIFFIELKKTVDEYKKPEEIG